MDRAETLKILAILKQAYPNAKETDGKATAALWADQFSKYSAMDVYNATKRHIGVSKFMPTIAEIKSLLAPTEGLWDLCLDLRMDNDIAEMGLETAPYTDMEKTAQKLKYGLEQEPGELFAGHIKHELTRWEWRQKEGLEGAQWQKRLT